VAAAVFNELSAGLIITPAYPFVFVKTLRPTYNKHGVVGNVRFAKAPSLAKPTSVIKVVKLVVFTTPVK